MSTMSERCTKCHGDYEAGSVYCPKCSEKRMPDSAKICPPKSQHNSYIIQIVSIGIRSDNVYEAKMLLAPQVDMSSTKITVKGNNLRVSVQRPLSQDLSDMIQKSPCNDLTKQIVKHRENLLIPETIDSDEVRAVVDNNYQQAEMKTEGFKVSTAALATDKVLNIKLQELGGRRHLRNINFLIPPEANAKIASIEMFDDNTIFMRAPLEEHS